MSHVIWLWYMYFSFFRKLSLQMQMRSHPVGLDVFWFDPLSTSILHVYETAKALTRLAWAFAGRLCDKYMYHNLKRVGSNCSWQSFEIFIRRKYFLTLTTTAFLPANLPPRTNTTFPDFINLPMAVIKTANLWKLCLVYLGAQVIFFLVLSYFGLSWFPLIPEKIVVFLPEGMKISSEIWEKRNFRNTSFPMEIEVNSLLRQFDQLTSFWLP